MQTVNGLENHKKTARDPSDTSGLVPALLVTPPKGLEAGHVPIVTRQEAAPR